MLPTINDFLGLGFKLPPQTYDIVKMVGHILFEQSPLVYVALIIAILAHYVLYKTVFGMYLPLRQQFGKIPQELEDLELVLNSMVEEIQDWEHEGKIRWIKTRAKDMFKLIEDYTRIYPQVTKFLNPINHHLSINE